VKSRFVVKKILVKYTPFLVPYVRKVCRFSVEIVERCKNIIMYKLLGKRRNRNQWLREKRAVWEMNLKKVMSSWEETEVNSPYYFKRLKFSVSKAKGRVLEIGCGIGAMTKWLSEAKEVEEIVAIDAFSEAINELKKLNLAKVIPLEMKLEHIQFNAQKKFDTVLICEVLEHIYPDEELKMLNAIRSYIDSTTRYVISTPIGWMPDPHHVRFFSKKRFKKHLKLLYGDPIEINYSSEHSQVAWGYFK